MSGRSACESTAPLLHEEAVSNRKSSRLVCLDVLRGITIALMILVDYCGESTPLIDHAPWNGIRLADFVMPSFDFIVGVSVVLSMQGGRMRNKPKLEQLNISLCRAGKLFLIGVLTQAGTAFPTYDLKHLRIMGILQRVALCYLTAAVTEIYAPLDTTRSKIPDCHHERWSIHRDVFVKRRWQWIVSTILVATHSALLYGLDDGCGLGATSPYCNGASLVDRHILGTSHMYFPTNGGAWEDKEMTFQRTADCSTCPPGRCVPPPSAPSWCGYEDLKAGHPFDPEGLVSSLTAVVAALIGTHCGAVAVLMGRHKDRLSHFVMLGLMGCVLGCCLDLSGLRLNTDLYSLSYLLLSTGAAILALLICYILVEMMPTGDSESSNISVIHWTLKPFHWLGMNSILIYLLSCSGITQSVLECFYWGEKDHNLAEVFYPTGRYWGPDYGDGFIPTETHYGTTGSVQVLCWCLFAYIPVWVALAGYLHRIKWYLKI